MNTTYAPLSIILEGCPNCRSHHVHQIVWYPLAQWQCLECREIFTVDPSLTCDTHALSVNPIEKRPDLRAPHDGDYVKISQINYPLEINCLACQDNQLATSHLMLQFYTANARGRCIQTIPEGRVAQLCQIAVDQNQGTSIEYAGVVVGVCDLHRPNLTAIMATMHYPNPIIWPAMIYVTRA